MFELPKYKGIEEAMQDIKVVARDQGIERCIGLLPDGTRWWDVLGDDTKVEMPDGKTGRDVFIIHGHPGMPCELSDADLYCILGTDAKGNMAVSGTDDTVSWSSGIEATRDDVTNPFASFLIRQYAKSVVGWAVRKIDPDKKDHHWSDDDDRYVLLSHLCNARFLETGFLKDYHLQIGEREQAILDKYAYAIKAAK